VGPGIDLSIAYPMLVTGYEALIVQWNEKWPARFDDVTSPQSATKGLTNVHISNYRWRFRHAVFGSGNDWDGNPAARIRKTDVNAAFAKQHPKNS